MKPGPEASRLAVFAKAPVPGAVKTRLAPAIGARAAARLHESLVRHALRVAIAGGAAEVELWCAPDERHEFFARCARDFGVRLKPQGRGDLGERMEAAFREAFDQGRTLVLIGSDCPGLEAADLRAAHAALATHDAVFTPAEDGGYVLVGLSRPLPGLFSGIDWGSAAVMRQTRERLAAAGARVLELPTRWDVDRPEDYARLGREGLLREALP